MPLLRYSMEVGRPIMRLEPNWRVASGFTLLELLVTMAVAGILVSIAAPSFQNIMQQSSQDSRVTELNGMLNFARSEAIKRSSRVSVCARDSDTICGTDWNNGWLVFLDNGEDAGVVEALEPILKTSKALPSNFTLKNTAIVSGAADANQRSYIRFGPRGLSNWRGSGSFTFCNDRGTEAAKGINVSVSGDVRQARRNDTGTLYDSFGNAITCEVTP